MPASGNYGIFSGESQGPGIWNQLYANNMSDSGTYIGACQQVRGHVGRPVDAGGRRE